jgi:transposase
MIDMKLQVLELTEQERAGLLKIVEKGRDWRMRHRAQTLLHFGDGLQAKAIAVLQNLHLDTVYDRRKHWLTSGFASLADKHRSGAPPKVSAAQREQLRMWATNEALTARELLTKLREEFDIVMHPSTLCVTLKKMGFVWKRTRHTLKKSEMN